MFYEVAGRKIENLPIGKLVKIAKDGQRIALIRGESTLQEGIFDKDNNLIQCFFLFWRNKGSSWFVLYSKRSFV